MKTNTIKYQLTVKGAKELLKKNTEIFKKSFFGSEYENKSSIKESDGKNKSNTR